ncbi:tripartite tricarboxylate transporter substrate binding protein [Fredinandcohnia onubensis]|uniref:tripartite tricarboxylate transporter substrate binding protein n=1 Tax=Fredinandcohnia onubensis TaxID=1571209 RepID=UPI000C0BE69F|nr:tripartite tricarboxylate transporter substrate binding protein [Fredinandcohnia onubensis]
MQLTNKLKLVSLLIIPFILFVLTGCGNSSTSNQESSNNSSGSYPEKDITMILPWAPGGSGDNTARPTIEKLSELLGTSVVLISKEGAGGSIGTGEVARAKADGYTLLNGGSLSTVVTTPLTTETGYSLDDLIPIAQLTAVSLVLATTPESPYQTLEELISYAKEHPGEVKVSTPGASSTQSIVLNEFMNITGTELELIPYDGSSPAYNALLNGEVDLWMGVESEMVGKNLTLLGTSSPERLEVIKDTPTFKEMGYEDLVFTSGFGVFAPKGTPEEIIQKIEGNLNKVYNDPEVQTVWKKAGLTPQYLGSDDYSKELKRQYDIAYNVLKELDLLKK